MFTLKGHNLWPFFSKLFIFGAFLYALLGMWFHNTPEVILAFDLNREELYMGMSGILLVMGILATIPGNSNEG